MAGLKRVMVPPECLGDLESDVPGTKPDVISVPNAKIYMPHVRSIRDQDAEVIIRNETTRRLARYNSDELELNVAGRQSIRRKWNHLFSVLCLHLVERPRSGAAGSGSAADAVRRRLQRDVYARHGRECGGGSPL